MPFKIEITYDTGDSFNDRPGQVDELDGTWTDYDVVCENIRRIGEHNAYHTRDYRDTPKTLEGKQKAAAKRPWYVKFYGSDTPIRLQLDDGTEYVQSTFWIGYFEHLRKVRAVSALMELEF